MNFYIKTLISILCFFPNIVSANDISRGFSNFIKSQMHKPQNKDKIVNLDVLLVKNKKIYIDKNKEPFSGMGVKFYKNGQLMTMLEIKSGSLAKQEWTCFYENGRIKYQIEKLDFFVTENSDFNLVKNCSNNPKNKKYGIEKKFYDNGEIEKRSVYKNNLLVKEETTSEIDKNRNKKFFKEIQNIMNETKNIPLKQITYDEINTVSNHIRKCWKAPHQKNFVPLVEIKIKASPNGKVLSSEIINKEQYIKDKNFKIIADSAIKAVNKCSLLLLPKDKYDLWKTLIFNFVPYS